MKESGQRILGVAENVLISVNFLPQKIKRCQNTKDINFLRAFAKRCLRMARRFEQLAELANQEANRL
ncbi:MAG: hypothetical protein M3Q34_04395 [bacterium]|nr:hypothetical protein [bacterium]